MQVTRTAVARDALACALVALVPGTAAAAPQCEPVERTTLAAADGAPQDYFGQAHEIRGNTACIGAHWHDDFGLFDNGAVYVFDRTGDSWSQAAKLTASDAASGAFLGVAIAFDGATILVGASGDDDHGYASGSVYVFELVGGAWAEVDKLTASDAAEDDEFGGSVALDGDTAIVGAWRDDDQGENAGTAYVFDRIGGAWMQTTKLAASDGAASAQFGWRVALSGDRAVVSSSGATGLGAAYVFERAGGVWSQTGTLAHSSGPYTFFGAGIALAGDSVLIGAPSADGPESATGAVYVYDQIGVVWTETDTLAPGDLHTFDRFGASIAASAHTAVIGAPSAESDLGAAYLYERIGGTWTPTARITASDRIPGDNFGIASLDGDTAIVASPNAVSETGKAYVFDLNCPGACDWDLDGDGAVGTTDLLVLLADWGSPYGTTDLLALLAMWGACS